MEVSAEVLEQIRSLYIDQEMTLIQVAVELGISKRTVHRLMQREGIPRRPSGQRNQSGANNPRWKGDAAGYSALHMRVEAARGKPTACSACGAADPDQRYEWANISGRYGNVMDYVRLCVSCHRRLDKARPIAKDVAS